LREESPGHDEDRLQGSNFLFEEEYSMIDSRIRASVLLKLVALLILLALVVGAVSSCGGSGAKSKEKTYPVAAVALESSARFDIMPQGRDCWISGAPGSVVIYGDTVRNGAGGGIVLVLSAPGALRIGEMSDVNISRGARDAPVVEIERGEAWLDVSGEKTGELWTPAVRVTASKTGGASVRCNFGVKVNPGGSATVVCADGTAILESAGATVTLEGGKQSFCEHGCAPGKPIKAETASPVGGFSFLVGLQSVSYFRNEATRDSSEAEARAKIAVNSEDAWSYVNMGRALLDTGNADEAKSSFAKALEIKPGFSQAAAGLGKIALGESRWSEASSSYEQARLADRTSLEALLGLASCALGAGDMREAAKRYKDAMEVDPQSHLALTGLGALKLLECDRSGATDDLEKSVQIEASSNGALVLLSCEAALEGNLERSLTFLKRAMEIRSDDYRIKSIVADRYARAGMSDAATSALRQLSQSDDSALMAQGFQGLGALAMARNDTKGAISDWTKAQDLMPDRPAVLENLARAYLLVGEEEAALSTISRAVVVDTNSWRSREMLARACLATGSIDQAAREARLAASFAPAQWLAHLALGLILNERGDVSESAREYDRALCLKPKGGMSVTERALLAEAYGHMGKVEEALAEYRKVVQMDPSDTLAYVKMAELLYASGHKDSAIDTLQRAVKKSPNDPDARLLLGKYLLADNDVEGALFQLDGAASAPDIRSDTLADVLVTRGNARDRKQEFAGAIDDYTRAISADPGRGDAWFYMAGDFERTGRPAEARAAYSNAVTLCGARSEWKKFHDEALKSGGTHL